MVGLSPMHSAINPSDQQAININPSDQEVIDDEISMTYGSSSPSQQHPKKGNDGIEPLGGDKGDLCEDDSEDDDDVDYAVVNCLRCV